MSPMKKQMETFYRGSLASIGREEVLCLAHVSHLRIFEGVLKDFEGDSDLASALERLELTADNTKPSKLKTDLLPHQVWRCEVIVMSSTKN